MKKAISLILALIVVVQIVVVEEHQIVEEMRINLLIKVKSWKINC